MSHGFTIFVFDLFNLHEMCSRSGISNTISGGGGVEGQSALNYN